MDFLRPNTTHASLLQIMPKACKPREERTISKMATFQCVGFLFHGYECLVFVPYLMITSSLYLGTTGSGAKGHELLPQELGFSKQKIPKESASLYLKVPAIFNPNQWSGITPEVPKSLHKSIRTSNCAQNTLTQEHRSGNILIFKFLNTCAINYV